MVGTTVASGCSGGNVLPDSVLGLRLARPCSVPRSRTIWLPLYDGMDCLLKPLLVQDDEQRLWDTLLQLTDNSKPTAALAVPAGTSSTDRELLNALRKAVSAMPVVNAVRRAAAKQAARCSQEAKHSSSTATQHGITAAASVSNREHSSNEPGLQRSAPRQYPLSGTQSLSPCIQPMPQTAANGFLQASIICKRISFGSLPRNFCAFRAAIGEGRHAVVMPDQPLKRPVVFGQQGTLTHSTNPFMLRTASAPVVKRARPSRTDGAGHSIADGQVTAGCAAAETQHGALWRSSNSSNSSLRSSFSSRSSHDSAGSCTESRPAQHSVMGGLDMDVRPKAHAMQRSHSQGLPLSKGWVSVFGRGSPASAATPTVQICPALPAMFTGQAMPFEQASVGCAWEPSAASSSAATSGLVRSHSQLPPLPTGLAVGHSPHQLFRAHSCGSPIGNGGLFRTDSSPAAEIRAHPAAADQLWAAMEWSQETPFPLREAVQSAVGLPIPVANDAASSQHTEWFAQYDTLVDALVAEQAFRAPTCGSLSSRTPCAPAVPQPLFTQRVGKATGRQRSKDHYRGIRSAAQELQVPAAASSTVAVSCASSGVGTGLAKGLSSIAEGDGEGNGIPHHHQQSAAAVLLSSVDGEDVESSTGSSPTPEISTNDVRAVTTQDLLLETSQLLDELAKQLAVDAMPNKGETAGQPQPRRSGKRGFGFHLQSAYDLATTSQRERETSCLVPSTFNDVLDLRTSTAVPMAASGSTPEVTRSATPVHVVAEDKLQAKPSCPEQWMPNSGDIDFRQNPWTLRYLSADIECQYKQFLHQLLIKARRAADIAIYGMCAYKWVGHFPFNLWNEHRAWAYFVLSFAAVILGINCINAKWHRAHQVREVVIVVLYMACVWVQIPLTFRWALENLITAQQPLGLCMFSVFGAQALNGGVFNGMSSFWCGLLFPGTWIGTSYFVMPTLVNHYVQRAASRGPILAMFVALFGLCLFMVWHLVRYIESASRTMFELHIQRTGKMRPAASRASEKGALLQCDAPLACCARTYSF